MAESPLLGISSVLAFALVVAMLRRTPPVEAPGAASRRNRFASAGCVLCFLLATHALIRDPEERANHQYLFTITLGYGHLIGAVVFSRRRLANVLPYGIPHLLLLAFVATGILTLFAIYTWILRVHPPAFLLLLGVSAWHTVENDLALERAYRDGLKLGPIPRSSDHHLSSIGLASLLMLLIAETPSWDEYSRALGGAALAVGGPLVRLACAVTGAALFVRHRLDARGLLGIALLAGGSLASEEVLSWLTVADLFVATTLYHLVSWLIFFSDRIRSLSLRGEGAAAARVWRGLLGVHVPPALICGGLLFTPTDALAPARFLLFSPAIYLFWSFVHVLQTAAVRELDRCSTTLKHLPQR